MEQGTQGMETKMEGNRRQIKRRKREIETKKDKDMETERKNYQ